MFICKPERNVRQTKLLVFFCAIITALIFLLSTVTPVYASLVRLLGFISLCVSILLCVRYPLTEFEYSLMSGDFSVTKIVGNRKQVICCVALETAISLMPKEEYKKLPSEERAIIKYSLNQNIRANSYVFLCNFNGKRAMIEFEPNAAFVSIFMDEIEKYKAQ